MVFVFGMVFIRIYINWRKSKLRALNTDEQNSRAVGFIVAANHQKNVLISSIQYSVVGLIYAVAYLPVGVYQIFTIYNGPVENKQGVLLAATIYNLISNNFISVMNILFYGFFSNVFRGEMVRIILLQWERLQILRKSLKRRISKPVAGVQQDRSKYSSTILDASCYVTGGE